MEHTRQNNDIKATKEARKLFNELRSNISREEINRIREKLYKKEAVYNFLKEKEQEGSITNIENKVLKNIGRYPKNIAKHLKNFKNDLVKLQKYQHNITYGLDYLFNELDEVDYYEPKEVKSAFDGSYMLYESKGDKDNKLALYEYFDIIKPWNEMHTKSDNITIMSGIETGDVINKLFNTFRKSIKKD